MNGGGGSDTFSYTAATDSVFGFKQQGKNVVADYSKSDVIRSFSKAAVDGDKIDLNQLLKSIGATGQFVKGLDANGNLTLDGNGSGATSNIGSFWLGKNSYLYGNLSGDQKADFAVSLTTNDAGAAFTGDALKDLVKYLDPNDPLNVNNLHLIF